MSTVIHIFSWHELTIIIFIIISLLIAINLKNKSTKKIIEQNNEKSFNNFFEKSVIIKLTNALFCVDCDIIFPRNKNCRCPKCANNNENNVIFLSSWLNRSSKKKNEIQNKVQLELQTT